MLSIETLCLLFLGAVPIAFLAAFSVGAGESATAELLLTGMFTLQIFLRKYCIVTIEERKKTSSVGNLLGFSAKELNKSGERALNSMWEIARHRRRALNSWE